MTERDSGKVEAPGAVKMEAPGAAKVEAPGAAKTEALDREKMDAPAGRIHLFWSLVAEGITLSG